MGIDLPPIRNQDAVKLMQPPNYNYSMVGMMGVADHPGILIILVLMEEELQNGISFPKDEMSYTMRSSPALCACDAVDAVDAVVADAKEDHHDELLVVMKRRKARTTGLGDALKDNEYAHATRGAACSSRSSMITTMRSRRSQAHHAAGGPACGWEMLRRRIYGC